MDTLYELLTYPIQRITALLFSLSIDGVSIGALLVSALLLGILFKALVGIHLSVFSHGRSVNHAGRNAGTRDSGTGSE